VAWRQHGLGHFDVVELFAHTLLMGPRVLRTLAHQHGHQKNGFFKGPWRALDAYITYVMGFVYGHVPEQYSMGHVRIHHRYDNGTRDITTTARMARSAPSSLVDQLVRQLGSQSGVTVFLHHWQCGRRREALRMARGMLFFYGLLLALSLWDPRVGLGYVLLPHLFIVMLIGGVNYVQHAFVDRRDPGNPYRNSITILDGKRNVFNEDFHAAHHLEPQANWRDLPSRFETDFDRYRDEGAIVFRDTHVYEMLFWILLGRRDLLARSLVDVGGTLSLDDKLALIDERLAWSYDTSGAAGGAGPAIV
jgi:fatty acid desaturase